MSTNATPKGAAGLRAEDTEPEASKKSLAGGLAGWVDDRTGTAKPVSYLLKKVFPDHWSFMLGEIAMFSLVIVLVTGVFLTFWFVPSAGQVIYNGSYVPLKGIAMSEAFKSTVDISFDVRGGLIIRQIHHWSALLFTVSITVHMFRVFFTGGVPQAARGQLGHRHDTVPVGHQRGLRRLLPSGRPALRHGSTGG